MKNIVKSLTMNKIYLGLIILMPLYLLTVVMMWTSSFLFFIFNELMVLFGSKDLIWTMWFIRIERMPRGNNEK